MGFDTNSFIIGYIAGDSSSNSSGGHGINPWVILILFLAFFVAVFSMIVHFETDLPECPLCGHEVRTPGTINSRAENFLEPIPKFEWSKDGSSLKRHYYECPYCHGEVEHLSEFD